VGMKKVIAGFLFLSVIFNILYFIPAHAWYYADAPVSMLTQSVSSEKPSVRVSPFVVEDQIEQHIAQAAVNATHAVVSVLGRQGNEVSVGSGFIYTHDGYILTNKHVVPYSTVNYKIMMYDGSVLDAEVVYRDPAYDIAVLKIDGTYSTIIPLGTLKSAEIGEGVAAIGNVMGLVKNTISTGTIESFDVNVRAEDTDKKLEILTGLIETNAYITPGFSGGPLIDESGQAVGMNVATSLTQDASYAIPIDLIQERIEHVL
jgi:S1-C subfamily serine protease